MKQPLFTGSCTAIVTPFTKDGKQVHVENLIKQVRYQIKNNTQALVVLGTTGEASTLTSAEKDLVVQTVVETVKGKIPVIVGVGSNCTQTTVENCKHFANFQVDAFLVVTPYYNKCTQNGLIAHYTEIANQSPLPIIMYNVPSRTGVNLLPQTVKTLSEHPNIIGVKEASGNLVQMSEILRICDKEFLVYSGDDGLTLPLLTLGGNGVISVASNVIPHTISKLCTSFMEGDLLFSRALHFMVAPFVSALFCEVNPIPVKKAMELVGLDTGMLRLPLTTLSSDGLLKLTKEMEALNLIGEK